MPGKQKVQQKPVVTPKTPQGPQQLKIEQSQVSDIMTLGQVKPLIESIEKKRGNRLIVLMYNDLPPVPSMLRPPLLGPLANLLMKMGKVNKLDLFLRSTGGQTEVPWRIVTMLREFTDDFSVLIPTFALSGATHISIAADEIVMSPFAVLGSVDPTRNHALLPKDPAGNPIPISVEDLKHCIKFVRDQLEESYQDQDLALIISELFKYINPLALGALEQSYNLSKLITRKCLGSRKNKLDDEHIDRIVEQLASGYFSHSFLISRSEVISDLGLSITKPDSELERLMYELEMFYLQRFQTINQLAPPNSNLGFRIGGVVQLSNIGHVMTHIIRPDGKLLVDPWLTLT